MRPIGIKERAPEFRFDCTRCKRIAGFFPRHHEGVCSDPACKGELKMLGSGPEAVVEMKKPQSASRDTLPYVAVPSMDQLPSANRDAPTVEPRPDTRLLGMVFIRVGFVVIGLLVILLVLFTEGRP